MSFKIMLVDDEPSEAGRLESLFAGDYQVVAASRSDEALWRLEQHDVALLVARLRTPSVTGIELPMRTASTRPHMVRIVLTDHADLRSMIDAGHRGEVYRCVTGSRDDEDLRLTVARAARHYTTNRARHEAKESNKRLSRRLSLDSLPAHRLTMLRLTRADLVRFHELTDLMDCGRLDRAAA